MGCNAISAQGTVIEIGDDSSPPNFTEIGSVKSYSGFDGSRAEIDTTCLTSDAKEFRLGLKDEGNVQLDVNVDFDDAGQQAVRAALDSPITSPFRFTYPTGEVSEFDALAKSFTEQGGVDGIIAGTISLRITGPRTIDNASA